MLMDIDKIIDYRDYLDDKEFLKYCEYELKQLKSKPETWKRKSGRIATWEEVQQSTYFGKAVEWYLIDKTRLQKCTVELLKKHGKYPRDYAKLFEKIEFQDLYDAQTDTIVEVKCWIPKYTMVETMIPSHGFQTFVKGYGKWIWLDRLMLYDKLNDYQARFKGTFDFRQYLKENK